MARQEIILLFWDCPECGHAHIPGPTQRCPNCFWWRDRETNFYEAPDSRVLSPEELEQFQGPDWICKVCGAANPERGEPVANLLCGNCQQWQTNSLDLGDAAPDDLAAGIAVAKKHGEWQDGFHLPPETAANSKRQPSRAKADCRKYGWFALIGLVAFGAVGVGWGLLVPRIIEAEVIARNWTVSIEIQELRPVREGGWSLPTGAYNVTSSQRQSGTREVQTGTQTQQVEVAYEEQVGTQEECTTVSRGDGTGERSCTDVPVYATRYRTETKEVPVYRTEPVYDTWYDYTIDAWQRLQVAVASGTDDQPRRPPAVSRGNSPYPQQTLAPVETCQVGVRYQRRQQVETQTWTLPCDQYDQLATGQAATFKRHLGQTALQSTE
ncbi:MAG: hypothetical protein HC910_15870 [Spirulinaceae cyanobacterium SM2_1_0]|nr:hypothetical protein [Spirulinaceae cyanobacterium SM2_1_0]